MSSNIHTDKEKQEKMDFSQLENKNNIWHKLKTQPDTNFEIKKAKVVLNLFVKTYSVMKIYPPENPFVRTSKDHFYENMIEFLDKYEELKITIGEFSFSFKGEKVYQDEEKKAGLPFLFFKDGMRELAFYKGLNENELQDLLKIIKEDSDLPPEDSDIVNTIWTKDFAHIRFFAIDEFLESDIGEEIGEIDFEIEKDEFTSGKLRLISKDKTDLRKRSAALGLQAPKGKKKDKDNEINMEDLIPPFELSAESEEINPELESMLEESRATPPLTGMINLLFEILYLEERMDQFSSTLNVLSQFFKEVIFNSNFALAFLILGRLQELKELFSGQFEEKNELLERIFQNARGESSLAYLKKLFLNKQIKDFDSFLQYLKLIGPSAIPLVGDIWEESEEPIIRLKASNVLHELGKKDIASLANLAKDHRDSLTKEVTVLLGRIGDKKALPYLKNLAGHQNIEIRLAVIYSLGKIEDESINEILINFLSDKDGDVRTRAAMSLKCCSDKMTFNLVMQLAKRRDFIKRKKLEKKALLKLLAMNQSEEVSALLGSLLKKRSVLSKSKQNETRICAVSALETIADPEARKILKEGAQIRNKTISLACKTALKKAAQKFEPNQIPTGEESA